MTKFTLKTYHINSKLLLTKICEFVDSIIIDFNIIWTSDSQRDTILDVIEEHLQDLKIAGDIEQLNVICDSRNNKQADIDKNVTNLSIEYTQRNCYNVSLLKYVITKS